MLENNSLKLFELQLGFLKCPHLIMRHSEKSSEITLQTNKVIVDITKELSGIAVDMKLSNGNHSGLGFLNVANHLQKRSRQTVRAAFSFRNSSYLPVVRGQ